MQRLFLVRHLKAPPKACTPEAGYKASDLRQVVDAPALRTANTSVSKSCYAPSLASCWNTGHQRACQPIIAKGDMQDQMVHP